jgi:hypothetical protein
MNAHMCTCAIACVICLSGRRAPTEKRNHDRHLFKKYNLYTIGQGTSNTPCSPREPTGRSSFFCLWLLFILTARSLSAQGVWQASPVFFWLPDTSRLAGHTCEWPENVRVHTQAYDQICRHSWRLNLQLPEISASYMGDDLMTS